MQRLARPFIVFVERLYPDPFVFAIGLSVVVFLMCLGLTDAGPIEAMRGWGEGLPALMTFIAQLGLALVAAHSLAHTDAVRGLMERLGAAPRSPAMAYAMVAVIAGVASLFAWALGLVVGGLIARQVAISAKERGLRLHYPLLVAAAYAGFVVWHMGYSGSAPLFVATPDHIVEEQIGIVPVTETIFAWWNIVIAAITLVVIAVIMALVRPSDEEIVEFPDDAVRQYRAELAELDRELEGGESVVAEARTATATGTPDVDAAPATDSGERSAPADAQPSAAPALTFGQRVDRMRFINLIAGGALAVWLVLWFSSEGLNLTLDIVNWTFLSLALLLSRSPLHIVKLITRAASSVGQIIFQFPFYAGIMGMMTATGLVTVIAGWFIAISTNETLGFTAFLSAGLVNIFIPSGGGQWAVQAPIFIEAAEALGTSSSVIVMAIAYGDQWTNMVQPFWSIPLLAIAGLHMRQIMGYTFLILFATLFVFGGGILLVGAFV